jgi:hypothetical protein
MRPFFTYFGGKWRSAPFYPAPDHTMIIEPFAGSAGYSLRYPSRQIVLIEKSEAIAAIWDYLIHATAADVLALPLLEPGQSVDTLDVSQAARWLIGMWVNPGSSQPKKTLGRWKGSETCWSLDSVIWSAKSRRRIARQVGHIRHWRIIRGDYSDAPDVSATWYVDPPYQGMGKHYPHGADAINFPTLAKWCRSRRGQVLVCENFGATWLPFRFLGNMKANPVNASGVSREAIWTNEPDRQGSLFNDT